MLTSCFLILWKIIIGVSNDSIALGQKQNKNNKIRKSESMREFDCFFLKKNYFFNLKWTSITREKRINFVKL